MDSETHDALELSIERALRTEPRRPAPPELRGEVMRRLDLVALSQRERAAFPRSLGWAAASLLLLAGLAALSAEPLAASLSAIPGAMGRLDSWRTLYLNTPLLGLPGPATLGLALGLAASAPLLFGLTTTAAALAPRRPGAGHRTANR